MFLKRLYVGNVRCVREARLEPGKGVNLLVGNNGAGKTTILEAVYFLGHGKSFKGTEVARLMGHGEKLLEVAGEVVEEGRVTRLGIQKSAGRGRIRVNGREAWSNQALAERLVVGAFYPGRERLVWGERRERRALLDWLMFHVEPSYGGLSRDYAQGIRGRNALLRRGASDRELASWSAGLAELGDRIHDARQAVVNEWIPGLESHLAGRLKSRVQVRYARGWAVGDDGLGATWAGKLRQDRERGWTAAGPHRADLVLDCASGPCKDVLSRGEGKTLALELFFGAVEFLRERTGRSSVLLLDDIYSELDAENRDSFVARLQAMGNQAFVTTVDPASGAGAAGGSATVFHVEQGRVS